MKCNTWIRVSWAYGMAGGRVATAILAAGGKVDDNGQTLGVWCRGWQNAAGMAVLVGQKVEFWLEFQPNPWADRANAETAVPTAGEVDWCWVVTDALDVLGAYASGELSTDVSEVEYFLGRLREGTTMTGDYFALREGEALAEKASTRHVA